MPLLKKYSLEKCVASKEFSKILRYYSLGETDADDYLLWGRKILEALIVEIYVPYFKKIFPNNNYGNFKGDITFSALSNLEYLTREEVKNKFSKNKKLFTSIQNIFYFIRYLKNSSNRGGHYQSKSNSINEDLYVYLGMIVRCYSETLKLNLK